MAVQDPDGTLKEWISAFLTFPRTFADLDLQDTNSAFRAASLRLEHRRINEILTHEVSSHHPSYYTELIRQWDLSYRYVRLIDSFLQHIQ